MSYIPPYFERGKIPFADRLNQMIDVLRSCILQPGVGYTVQRSLSGQTLQIQNQGGGGGGETAAMGPCYYSVSDATIVEGTPIIEVSRELLPIQAGESGDPYRYPYGMTEVDAFKITIDSTFENWAGLYLKLEFNEDGLFRQYPEAARFRLSDRPLISGDQNQFILCSEISLSINEQGKKYISNINNLCPLITGNPLGSCHFGIEDAGDEYPDPNTVMVEVRVGKLNGVTPMGMTFGLLGTDRFLIDLPSAQGEWFAIYLVVLLDNTGNISPVANALQFVAYNDYQKNTTNYSFILAAEITCSYDGNGNRYASAVRSYCVPQFWNTLGQGRCPFLVYDNSILNGAGEPEARVSVSRGLVDSYWPNGMGWDPNLSPVTLQVSQNSYVVLKMVYNTETYALLPPSGEPPINDNLVFEIYPTIPAPTEDTAYQLIATVSYDPATHKITDVYNQCNQPISNPCMLQMPI